MRSASASIRARSAGGTPSVAPPSSFSRSVGWRGGGGQVRASHNQDKERESKLIVTTCEMGTVGLRGMEKKEMHEHR